MVGRCWEACPSWVPVSLLLVSPRGSLATSRLNAFFFLFTPHTFTFQFLDKPWSQVSSLFPLGSCLKCLSRIGFSNPIARRFFIECSQLLTHALALSASQFVHKKKSQRICTSMHSAGLELTKLTYLYQARGYINLIRHRGDRLSSCTVHADFIVVSFDSGHRMIIIMERKPSC